MNDLSDELLEFLAYVEDSIYKRYIIMNFSLKKGYVITTENLDIAKK